MTTALVDFLGETGMADKLRGIKQIGMLMEAADRDSFYGDMGDIGALIERTIDDFFESVDAFDSLQDDEVREILKKIPPDPKKIAKEKAHRKELALYMIDQTRFVSPETAEAIKQVIEEAEEFQGLTSADDEPGEDD